MLSESTEENNEVKIGNMFSIFMNKKLGSGAFGEIYKGINLKTNEEVAIKLESVKSKTPQLNYESKIYKLLQGGIGIPNVYHVTPLGEYTIMVLEFLDKNLDELMMQTINKKFSLKTVLMVADQIISRVEFVHSKNILHRDIKPENFVLGVKKKSHIIYMIDYGLAKRYRDPKTGEHIPYIEGKSLTGTARYASIYTHLGIEQSRRDDLEGIGYLLLYLLRGSLPWQGLKAKTKKEKYKKIMDKKIANTPEVLCEGIAEEFVQFFKYVRELQFEEKPDYQFIKDLFKKLLIKNEWYNDFNFDWLLRPKEEAVSSSNFGMELNFFTKLNTVDENKNAMKIVSRRGSGLGDVLNVAKRLSGVTLKDEK